MLYFATRQTLSPSPTPTANCLHDMFVPERAQKSPYSSLWDISKSDLLWFPEPFLSKPKFRMFKTFRLKKNTCLIFGKVKNSHRWPPKRPEIQFYHPAVWAGEHFLEKGKDHFFPTCSLKYSLVDLRVSMTEGFDADQNPDIVSRP